MPRTAGATGKYVYRIKFTDTETGHNWYVGPYSNERQTKALRTRKVNQANADPKRDGMKPLKGVIEPGRVRWEEADGSD